MKRKNVSRVIALALASVMCFSACGQEKPVTSSESAESKVQESTESEAEVLPYWELLDQVSDTSELPDWTGEVLEVNIWSAGGSSAKLGEIPDTNVTYKEFERVTGVRINAEESFDNGGVSVDAKLPMVIASGDLPTIIMGYSMDQTMRELYDNGYLADLTKYYEDGTLDQLDKVVPFDKGQDIVYKNYQADDGSYYLLPFTPTNITTMASVFDMMQYYPEQYDREFYLTKGKAPKTIGNKGCLDTVTFDEKCLAGHYAVAYHNTDLAQLPEDTAEWRYSPVWINVPANESMGGMTQLSVNAYFGVFKDSLTEEQLDQLMHAINYLNSEVGMNNFFWGPQSAGLFDVDAEGKCYYSDPEVKAAMEDGVDNGAHIKYGLRGAKGIATSAYLDMPWGLISDLIMPRYINQGQGELKASDAITYYNPGILPGLAYEDSTMYFTMNASVYSGAGQTIEGLKQFWAARTGFENQMKKLIVAESDAEFDKKLAALDAYAIENGFDDKALQEFNDKFVEANMDALKLYGFIE